MEKSTGLTSIRYRLWRENVRSMCNQSPVKGIASLVALFGQNFRTGPAISTWFKPDSRSLWHFESPLQKHNKPCCSSMNNLIPKLSLSFSYFCQYSSIREFPRDMKMFTLCHDLFRLGTNHFRLLLQNLFTSQRTHDVIITSLLRQNDVATSFWRNNDVLVTSWAAHALLRFSNCR